MKFWLFFTMFTVISTNAYAGSLEVVSHYLRRMAEAEEYQMKLKAACEGAWITAYHDECAELRKKALDS